MALRDAFLRAREMNADILVCLDGDGQHNPDEIPRLLIPIKNGEADMVIGSRFLDIQSDIPRYRRAGQKVLTSLTNTVSATKVTDSQSGFRAFSKKAIDSMSLEENGIGIESAMQRAADDSGLRITEVPITCRYDIEHASKMGSVQARFFRHQYGPEDCRGAPAAVLLRFCRYGAGHCRCGAGDMGC